MIKASKKTKPSTQKAAFASIFRKANQHAKSRASPGRKKAAVTAKVTTTTGSELPCEVDCEHQGACGWVDNSNSAVQLSAVSL